MQSQERDSDHTAKTPSVVEITPIIFSPQESSYKTSSSNYMDEFQPEDPGTASPC